jgi:hypothetical protein
MQLHSMDSLQEATASLKIYKYVILYVQEAIQPYLKKLAVSRNRT